jgi:hypothetical protein
MKPRALRWESINPRVFCTFNFLTLGDQLGPLPSGLSRAWSWPLVATVTSDIVDVLEFGKPPCSERMRIKALAPSRGGMENAHLQVQLRVRLRAQRNV